MRELTLEEVETVAGASAWGDNVLKYGGGGALIGGFISLENPAFAAGGFLLGAAVGTAVTFL